MGIGTFGGFRDGLVWALDLTIQIKLRFQISPAYFRLGPSVLVGYCLFLYTLRLLRTGK